MTQLNFWIVSPDAPLGNRWETLMRREGWNVLVERDFNRFAADAIKSRFGIAMVDWSCLRAAGGAAAIGKLKAKAAGVSVVLLSGAEVSPMKVIDVLEAGADDHFLKNLDDRLLVAKLKAHLRRILPSLASALDVLKAPGGEVKLDRSKQEAWIKGMRGRWAPVMGLTRTEFQLLALFLEQPGKVLERQYMLDIVWKGQGVEVQPGTVDKHIESLRRKLGKYGSMIRTVYGVGYAFRES